jgi:hypothetical protein
MNTENKWGCRVDKVSLPHFAKGRDEVSMLLRILFLASDRPNFPDPFPAVEFEGQSVGEISGRIQGTESHVLLA